MDWFLIPNSKITSVTSIKNINSQGFTIMNEILLFIILFSVGVVCSIVFGLIRLFKYDKAQADNENLNEKKGEGHENEHEDVNHILVSRKLFFYFIRIKLFFFRKRIIF